ncbi:hypothetical protein CHU98_g6448 [Xylaria longipes]|nr:hypothetical protein CHU98_g6448 [Xylaria longipes]
MTLAIAYMLGKTRYLPEPAAEGLSQNLDHRLTPHKSSTYRALRTGLHGYQYFSYGRSGLDREIGTVYLGRQARPVESFHRYTHSESKCRAPPTFCSPNPRTKPTYEDLPTKTYLRRPTYEDLPTKTYADLPTQTYLRRPTYEDLRVRAGKWSRALATQTYQVVWKPTYEDLRTKTYEDLPTKTYEDLPTKTYEDLPTKTYVRRPTSAYELAVLDPLV